jgi:DNA-binding MarR family transcriptional regulator
MMATKFITVSIDIMHNKDLNQSQKFMLAEIEQLSSLEKGCIATNEHFARLIGITKENVSRNINNLQDKGYINIEIKNGSRNHIRMITLIKTATLTTLVKPPYQSSKPPLSKQQETKGNRTINKTSNITINEQFDNIWDLYIKKKGKSAISLSTKKTLIKYSLDDWAVMIKRYSNEVNGWDLKYVKQGSTFFNGGYEDYLDENYIEKEVNKLDRANCKTQEEWRYYNYMDIAKDDLENPDNIKRISELKKDMEKSFK